MDETSVQGAVLTLERRISRSDAKGSQVSLLRTWPRAFARATFPSACGARTSPPLPCLSHVVKSS